METGWRWEHGWIGWGRNGDKKRQGRGRGGDEVMGTGWGWGDERVPMQLSALESLWESDSVTVIRRKRKSLRQFKHFHMVQLVISTAYARSFSNILKTR